MSDRMTQQKQPQSKEPRVADLPNAASVSPPNADAIKGGLMRVGNDEDDDLEDLEIQR